MSWSIVLGGALVPPPVAADVARAAQAPRLAHRLRRARLHEQPADSAEQGEASHLAWIARAFGVQGDALVTAPYAWKALGQSNAQGETIWFCDPVHFEIARDHIVLHRLDHAPLDGAEAAALAAPAAAVALAHGGRLARACGSWFVALPATWAIEAHALAAVDGRSIEDRLPFGADAARWRRLLTEIQMEWHEHPVNLARAAREVPVANGLWLHGGGTARPLPRARFARAISRDAGWLGWAAAAGATTTTAAAFGIPPGGPLGGPLGAPLGGPLGGPLGSPLGAPLGSSLGSPPGGPLGCPPAGTLSGLPVAAQFPGGDVIEDCDLLIEASRAEHWGLWLAGLAEVERLVEARCEAGFGHGVDAVDLVLCGDTVIRTARLAQGDRWRGWRRHRLDHVLADGVASR
jgi:hypothetical protein